MVSGPAGLGGAAGWRAAGLGGAAGWRAAGLGGAAGWKVEGRSTGKAEGPGQLAWAAVQIAPPYLHFLTRDDAAAPLCPLRPQGFLVGEGGGHLTPAGASAPLASPRCAGGEAVEVEGGEAEGRRVHLNLTLKFEVPSCH